MPATRKSARLADTSSSQEQQDQPSSTAAPAAGQKRKSAGTPESKAKRGKKEEQKTLEEVLPNAGKQDEKKYEEPNDDEMKAAADQVENEGAAKENGNNEKSEADGDAPNPSEETETHGSSAPKHDAHSDKGNSANGANGTAGDGSTMDNTGAIHKDQQGKEASDAKADSNGTIEVDKARKESEPSNVLEKGIIYFFIRARVGTGETPDSPDEIQRAYMVLRPLPDGTKLHEGPIPELKNCRLLALPKKVWPKSPKDRFMSFVEKANADVKELKEDFMKGSDYATKTSGTNHTAPVTPVGEGVYAITTQGRDSHMAYMLTIPERAGEIQTDIGLADKGSFVLSVKNPEFAGPANANLPQGPEFPKEILEEFRGLRWMGLQPKHLQYPNAQFLLIGEHAGDFGRATEQTASDEKHDKETPVEELEKLEDEDQFRAEALKGDNAVFADLGISHEDYPKLQTTW